MKRTSILILMLALATSCGASATDTASTETSTETASGGDEVVTPTAAPSGFEITLNGAPFTPVSILVANYDAGDESRRSIRLYDHVVACADAAFIEEGTQYVDVRAAWTSGEQSTLMVGAGDASSGTSWEIDGRFALEALAPVGGTVNFTVEAAESTGPGDGPTVAIRGSGTAEVCL